MCGTSNAGDCDAGVLVWDKVNTAPGATQTWFCKGEYYGEDSDLCTYTNPGIPTMKSCYSCNDNTGNCTLAGSVGMTVSCSTIGATDLASCNNSCVEPITEICYGCLTRTGNCDVKIAVAQ